MLTDRISVNKVQRWHCWHI